jgi:hypothetical protein
MVEREGVDHNARPSDRLRPLDRDRYQVATQPLPNKRREQPELSNLDRPIAAVRFQLEIACWCKPRVRDPGLDLRAIEVLFPLCAAPAEPRQPVPQRLGRQSVDSDRPSLLFRRTNYGSGSKPFAAEWATRQNCPWVSTASSQVDPCGTRWSRSSQRVSADRSSTPSLCTRSEMCRRTVVGVIPRRSAITAVE